MIMGSNAFQMSFVKTSVAQGSSVVDTVNERSNVFWMTVKIRFYKYNINAMGSPGLQTLKL